MKKYLFIVFSLILFFATQPFSSASEKKLPRFASTKTAETNIRVGPGDAYPISWVLLRAQLPLEIIDEFDHWRQIRDWEGTTGWVHKSMLQGKKRYVLVTTEQKIPLYASSDNTSQTLAYIEPKVICQAEKCIAGWCQVKISNVTGWIKTSDIWGVYPTEKIN